MESRGQVRSQTESGNEGTGNDAIIDEGFAEG